MPNEHELTKEQAREMLKKFIGEKGDLPIVDQNIQIIKSTNPLEFTKYTFRELLKIAYDLQDKTK